MSLQGGQAEGQEVTEEGSSALCCPDRATHEHGLENNEMQDMALIAVHANHWGLTLKPCLQKQAVSCNPVQEKAEFCVGRT